MWCLGSPSAPEGAIGAKSIEEASQTFKVPGCRFLRCIGLSAPCDFQLFRYVLAKEIPGPDKGVCDPVGFGHAADLCALLLYIGVPTCCRSNSFKGLADTFRASSMVP